MISGPSLIRLPTAGSTNDDLAAMARGGAPHGTALLAEAQTGGRGRLGRKWEGAAGNLYLSILLRPALPPARIPMLCLAAAVAVAEACDARGSGVRIKWPNDLVAIDDRKIGGILAESELRGSRVEFVVVGIGINLVASPPDLPEAVSLRALGIEADRDEIAPRIVRNFLDLAAIVGRDPSAILDRWRARAATLGRAVVVGEISGIAEDLDTDGGLLVRDSRGTLRRVLAGDVRMVAETQAG